MKEKFKRLTDEVCILTTKIEPGTQQNSLIQAKLERILFKIHDIERVINEIIPDLQAQLKDKETCLKKIKRNLKNSQERVSELLNKKEKFTKNGGQPNNYKSKLEQCKCFELSRQEEKYKYKLDKINELLKVKKQKIQELEQRVRILQDKNHDLIQDNKSQLTMIEELLCQFEAKSIAVEHQDKDSRTSGMMQEDDDSSLRKQSDDIQTDDQLEFEYYSDSESDHSQQIIEKQQVIKENDNEQVEKQTKVLQNEGQNSNNSPTETVQQFKWSKQIFWFLL